MGVACLVYQVYTQAMVDTVEGFGAPPSDFSCVSGQERWEHDQARSSVVRNPAKVLDDKWVEPEDYARYQYLLNLPGETSGSYSRNLNHLRGGGVF